MKQSESGQSPFTPEEIEALANLGAAFSTKPIVDAPRSRGGKYAEFLAIARKLPVASEASGCCPNIVVRCQDAGEAKKKYAALMSTRNRERREIKNAGKNSQQKIEFKRKIDTRNNEYNIIVWNAG